MKRSAVALLQKWKKGRLPISPGDILVEELEARGLTNKDLATAIGRPYQMVSEIISGKKSVTVQTAVEFAYYFGTSPEYWLTLQALYDLDVYRFRHGNNGKAVQP